MAALAATCDMYGYLLQTIGMEDVLNQVCGLMVQILHIPVPNCIVLQETNVEVHVGFEDRLQKVGRRSVRIITLDMVIDD